jgi:hypothetical protein
MGANTSKVDVLSARLQIEEEEEVKLSLKDLGIPDLSDNLSPEMQRFNFTLSQLQQIRRMHEDLLNDSTEDMDSRRIEQVQLETFLKVFS